jgi:hypothetical protein
MDILLYLIINPLMLLIAVRQNQGTLHYWTEHNPTGFHRSQLSKGMLKNLDRMLCLNHPTAFLLVHQ